jgi:hypothetical protein
VIAALGVLGVALCALSPAWGARGHHGMALSLVGMGATLALCAALLVLFAP